MKRLIQHDVLFIRHFLATEWPFELHNHNHFELIFIHSGTGIHQLNGQMFDYKGPCWFMLAPSDEHIFHIKEATQFTVLKFNNVYLSQQNGSGRLDWDKAVQRLIILSKEHNPSLISDIQLKNLNEIMWLIAREWQQNPSPSNEIVLHLTRAAISLMIRVTEEETPVAASPSSEKLSQALHYIHLHISDPEQLHTEVIAGEVQLSKARLTTLFKQETGMSIKDYINEYKFRQIENRLKYSSQTIKEISNEFAFADLSHLNKFVRRMKGLNPRDYRIQLKTGG